MKLSWVFLLFSLLFHLPAGAQSPESYRGLLTQQVKSGKLEPPQHLNDYVSDGKLTLSLRDAVALALENNSNVRIQESQIEGSKFSLLGFYQPFDPLLQGVVNLNRYSYSGYTELQGVGNSSNATFNQLTQSAQINYIQTFETGTNVNLGIGSTKSSTNSDFYYFNPYFNSVVEMQFTQPLLRNFGRFANTANLVIARRTLQQSRAAFAAQVSDAILQVVTQYGPWSRLAAICRFSAGRSTWPTRATSTTNALWN